MKILALTHDSSILKIIKKVCKNREYALKIIKTEEGLINLIDTSLINFMFYSLFNKQYDVILLDLEFLNIINSLNLKFQNGDVMNYPTLLFINDYSELDVEKVISLKISSMISLPLTECKLDANLHLVASNFKLIKKIQKWAFIDPLTSIYNRRTLIKNLENYFIVYKKFKVPFCLAIIDLDFFKRINDTYGHSKGDEVLEFFARIMKKNVRKTDIVARMGGEEFAIIFPDTSLNKANNVLIRIQKGLKLDKEINEEINLTISVGIVEINPKYQSYDHLINDVDKLLYKAKDTGRNKIIK